MEKSIYSFFVHIFFNIFRIGKVNFSFGFIAGIVLGKQFVMLIKKPSRIQSENFNIHLVFKDHVGNYLIFLT